MADTVVTKLEYWSPSKGKFVVGHEGVGLLHPERYVERLSQRGKVGRATILETGEVFQILPTPKPDESTKCDLCEEQHGPPHDGSCLF